MPPNDPSAPGLPRRRELTRDDYVKGVLAGDRAILGRAISLVESNAQAHHDLAQEVLTALLPHTGNARRVGISGVPGVGKSTFIEALGKNLTAKGHKVAVLAVDPTSERTKGSILGDKTRMVNLSQDINAFRYG
jgi:LAO/AO transport system kinase